MPPDKATSGGTARFPGPMYAGVRLEGAHVLHRRARLYAHLEAVAGAPVVTWKRNIRRFGNIPGQQFRAGAEPARGENDFSRGESTACRHHADYRAIRLLFK